MLVFVTFMHLSHWYVPQLEVLLSDGTTPSFPHFIQVVHTTGRRPLTGRGFKPSITVEWQYDWCRSLRSNLNLLSVAIRQTPGETTSTLTRLMLLYYTETWPNYNLTYTVDHTFGYHSQKFKCACAKSSLLAHSTEIRGTNFKHFKLL